MFFKNKVKSIFCFFPLASVGGTESVHADVLKALSSTCRITIFIRYRANIWKGQAFASTAQAKEEGKAMLGTYKQYSSLVFVSHWLEAPQLGRIIRLCFMKWMRFKLANTPDLVILFWHRDSISPFLPFIPPHVPIIDIIHNQRPGAPDDYLYLNADFAERMHRRVLISDSLRKLVTRSYAFYGKKLPDNQLIAIPHTVDVAPELPRKHHITSFNVLFVGREATEKRIHLVLEIASRCLHMNLPVNFSLAGPDASSHDQVPPNVEFLGTVTNRNELNQLYSRNHVLLLCSSSEGFPKTIAEGMGFGTVPISTCVGSIPDHVRPELGYLTNPEPEATISESVMAIQELINNPEHYLKLSETAYQYARKYFSWEQFQQSWQNVIEECQQ